MVKHVRYASYWNAIFTGRNEVLAKVIFSEACVILSTGGCLVPGGCLQFSEGVSGPGGCLVLGGVWSQGVSGPGGMSGPRGCLQFFGGGRSGPRGVSTIFRGGGVWSGGVWSRGGVYPPEYGQRSAGTHPTGMNSCLKI